jgi:hypothetical protein
VRLPWIDPDAWEGPYTVSRNDEAQFRLQRQGSGSAAINVVIEFSGTAKAEEDFTVTDHLRNELPLSGDMLTGKSTVTVVLSGNQTTAEFFIIATMDSDYELPEDVTATILDAPGYTVGQHQRAVAIIIDKTADLDITTLNSISGFLDEDLEDDPGANIRRDDDYDMEQSVPDMQWY